MVQLQRAVSAGRLGEWLAVCRAASGRSCSESPPKNMESCNAASEMIDDMVALKMWYNVPKVDLSTRLIDV